MDGLGKNKDDFTCPICMYIMIQPVTMPCKHSLCMICYKQCVEKASLACPICRLRIAVWARKNSKANTLIDRVLWENIQRLFPVEVRNKIEGKDDSTDDNWDSPSAIETKLRKIKELSEPGAIRQEYEAALAKLERQREEEAKKEEEASAALIRALQEEEEEELAKLMKEREEHERLGRLAVEQLLQGSDVDQSRSKLRDSIRTTSRNSSRNGSKQKQKRCESASMKLESFYNSFRKSSNSAPPYSEMAATVSHSQDRRKNGQGSTTNYSPYPYPCISPSEKQKVTPNLPSEAYFDEMDEISPFLQEHSYTTASAEKVDLTLQGDECDLSTILRDDVQKFVKTEPPDIDGGEDPLSTNNNISHSFQPICSSLRTPPKKLQSGELVDPVLIRTIPRSLTFCFSQRADNASPSTSSCSSEIFLDQSSDYSYRRDVENMCQSQSSLLARKKQDSAVTLSSPAVSVVRHSDEKSDDDYVDKLKLTRKIVYGTFKNKKRAVSSTCSLPQSTSHSSSLSSISTSSKDSLCLNSSTVSPTKDVTTTASSTSLSVCLNNTIPGDFRNGKGFNKIDKSDYFITNETQLIIPLESDIQATSYTGINDNAFNDNNNKTNDFNDNNNKTNDAHTARTIGSTHIPINMSISQNEKLEQVCEKIDINKNYARDSVNLESCTAKSVIKKTSQTTLPRKKISKNCMDPSSSTSSIKNWCMGKKRKVDSDILGDSYKATPNHLSNQTLNPEEADHLFALELQELYSKQERRGIKVDRFEGSSNEYMFRKKRKLN